MMNGVGPLRGRDAERDGLDLLAARAADGAGGIVVLSGGAGIGKTRLLAEAARLAAARDVEVAAGAADELDQVTPWGPLLRALASTDPVALDEEELASLRALLDQRLAVIDRIGAAIERAASKRPLLIVLDDVQWADQATLLALGTLPWQMFSHPVGWLLALRPQPSSPRLQTLIGRLTQAGARTLHLGPLGEHAAAELAQDLLGAPPDPPLAELITRADGNPLYVTELVRSMGQAPWLGGAAPASFHAAVTAHLRTLPDQARDLLKVASALGRQFSVTELEAMTGEPASALLPSLEQALLAEVITDQGSYLAFRHDLLRAAVYDQMPAPLRQALHRDAAAALRRTGAPLARVATHYAAAAQPGDQTAIETLTAAAGELSATSPSAAADLAVRAVGLMDAADPRRATATATAAGLLGWAGRLDDASALGEAYLAECKPPPEVEAQIVLGIRRAWALLQIRPYPTPLPHRLLTDDAVPPAIRVGLLTIEQQGPMWAGDFAATDRAFEAAERLAAQADPQARAEVLSDRVLSDTMRGDLTVALERARGALREVPLSPVTPVIAGLRYHVGAALVRLGQPDALAAVEETIRAAEHTGFTFIRCLSQQRRAEAVFALGRLDDARAEAHTAADTAAALGFADILPVALALLAEIAIRQADLGAAQAAVARLPPPGRSMYPDQHWARALSHDAMGRHRQALGALDAVFAQLRRGCLMFASGRADRLPWVVRLALTAGDAGCAAVAADAADKLANRNPGSSLFAALAAHARGLRDGDLGQLRRAASELAVTPWPLAAAAAREDLARLLADGQDRHEAIEQLEAAYETYTRAGAHRDLARVRGALRAVGVRKRGTAVARSGHGWASLTAAELAVVETVAEGRTNREAAAQLYLSPDTINTHLRHAFAKLGIRSRVELARLVISRRHETGAAEAAKKVT